LDPKTAPAPSRPRTSARGEPSRTKRKVELADFAWALALNTAIAAVLTILVFRSNGFWANLVFSQCIGLSIYLLVSVLIELLPRRLALLGWAIGLPVGFVAGMTLASLLLKVPIPLVWLSFNQTWAESLMISLVCTVGAGYFFWSRERIAAERAAAEEQKAQALLREKQALVAQLKALQAQIEPHFLFNTLANVVSLIEKDGPRARLMLEDLIDFLRASLNESRTRQTTLGRQAELLESYLRLLKIRMGERLAYRIEIAPEAEQAALPPMLLQPLVENAIKHGLEPKIEGGEVSVLARAEDGTLRITVSDTGLGWGEGQGGTGVGLANVRERLAALYDERGVLQMAPNTPCGLQVTISLPLEYS